MWKRINLCFPVSAAKLLSCNYSYCKIMGVSLLIAPLREKKKKRKKRGVLLLGEERFSLLSLATRMAQ